LWGSWCPARMSLSCPRCPPLSPWAVAEGVVQGLSRRDFSWRKDRVGFGRTGVHQDLPQETERIGPSECVGRRTKSAPRGPMWSEHHRLGPICWQSQGVAAGAPRVPRYQLSTFGHEPRWVDDTLGRRVPDG
jgi:hypothetical protein